MGKSAFVTARLVCLSLAIAASALSLPRVANAQLTGVEVGNNVQYITQLAKAGRVTVDVLNGAPYTTTIWDGYRSREHFGAGGLNGEVAAIERAIHNCDDKALGRAKQAAIEYLSAFVAKSPHPALEIARAVLRVSMRCGNSTYTGANTAFEIRNMMQAVFAPVAEKERPLEDILSEIEQDRQAEKANEERKRSERQPARVRKESKSTRTSSRKKDVAKRPKKPAVAPAEPLFEYTVVLPDRPQSYTARIVDKATGRTVATVSSDARTVSNWTPHSTLMAGQAYQLVIDGKVEAEFAPSEGQVLNFADRRPGQIQLSAGGTASWMQTPQIGGGTQSAGGSESSILLTSRWLHGSGAYFNFQWQLAEFLQTAGFVQQYLAYANAIQFFIKASYQSAHGSESASVPVGGNSVAQTYLFPNPDGGSTGISAGATGQSVTASTDARVYDVSPGLQFGLGATSSFGGMWTATPMIDIGVRYKNEVRKDQINQQSLTYADLNSNIGLDVQSNFVAPSIGAGLRLMPTGPAGVFVNVHGSVAPGVLWTSASATQSSRCGPCGMSSPQYNLSLERDFNNTTFGVVAGLGAEIGYQLSPQAKISISGSYEFTSRMPFLDVPVSPNNQPVALDYGSGQAWQIGAQLKVMLGDVTRPKRF